MVKAGLAVSKRRPAQTTMYRVLDPSILDSCLACFVRELRPETARRSSSNRAVIVQCGEGMEIMTGETQGMATL